VSYVIIVGCVALLITHGYVRQLRFVHEHVELRRGSSASFARSSPASSVATPFAFVCVAAPTSFVCTVCTCSRLSRVHGFPALKTSMNIFLDFMWRHRAGGPGWGAGRGAGWGPAWIAGQRLNINLLQFHANQAD
jgi:hypothetical protein